MVRGDVGGGGSTRLVFDYYVDIVRLSGVFVRVCVRTHVILLFGVQVIDDTWAPVAQGV